MTREEAIKEIKSWNFLEGKEIEAIETLIPELTERDEEMIMKRIRLCLDECVDSDIIRDYERDECLAYLENQNEQKSRLTVNVKGVYKICPHCKSRMIRDDSKVYTSIPPQYEYNCPKCGTMKFDAVRYDNPEMEEQKPAECIPDSVKFDEGFKTGRELGFREGVESVKTAEWSEEDEKIAKEIEEELWYPGDFPDYPSKEENKLYDDCQRRLNWFKIKLKSLRPQPKEEWSEEDDQLIGFIFDLLNDLVWRKDWAMRKEECLGLLTSLRQQLNQKWGEEDERMLSRCIKSIECSKQFADSETYKAAKDKEIDWLKSLRPSWNPSEEQMDALRLSGAKAIGEF